MKRCDECRISRWDNWEIAHFETIASGVWSSQLHCHDLSRLSTISTTNTHFVSASDRGFTVYWVSDPQLRIQYLYMYYLWIPCARPTWSTGLSVIKEIIRWLRVSGNRWQLSVYWEICLKRSCIATGAFTGWVRCGRQPQKWQQTSVITDTWCHYRVLQADIVADIRLGSQWLPL